MLDKYVFTVRYPETGEPVANARIDVWWQPGIRTGANTNAQGVVTLNGKRTKVITENIQICLPRQRGSSDLNLTFTVEVIPSNLPTAVKRRLG